MTIEHLIEQFKQLSPEALLSLWRKHGIVWVVRDDLAYQLLAALFDDDRLPGVQRWAWMEQSFSEPQRCREYMDKLSFIKQSSARQIYPSSLAKMIAPSRQNHEQTKWLGMVLASKKERIRQLTIEAFRLEKQAKTCGDELLHKSQERILSLAVLVVSSEDFKENTLQARLKRELESCRDKLNFVSNIARGDFIAASDKYHFLKRTKHLDSRIPNINSERKLEREQNRKTIQLNYS